MNLSIVLFAWKLSPTLLQPSLWTLSHQTTAPLEIVFVNTSPDSDVSAAYQNECAKYPLVRCITATQEKLNLSKSLNIGIRNTSPLADYVMTTSVEMLFSSNLLETLEVIMTPDVIGETPRGDLPIGYEWGNVETLYDRWPEFTAHCLTPIHKRSPGAVICIRRDWWFEVRGYDEVNTPYNYNDSDLLSRAEASGLRSIPIPWEVCQVLHLGHPRSPEYNSITSRIPHGEVVDLIRNDEHWGEP